MKMTVLFDLDDTLLGNDVDSFLKGYLKEITSQFPEVPSDLFAHELLSATGKMIANQEPEKTLEEVFDAAFYPAIGHSKRDLYPRLVYFYDKVFPGLDFLTEKRPEAVPLVNQIIKDGHDVVIATNPLYPRTATCHRIHWAGFPVDENPFKAVTTYEDYHFAKPNPAYFVEILGRLGFPAQPAVMIGNSLEEDILPAELLGIPTFWVNGSHQPDHAVQRNPLSQTGALSEVGVWLKKLYGKPAIFPVADSPKAILSTLLATLSILDFHKRTLPLKKWALQPASGSWSVIETICHLRDAENEIYAPRIHRFLREDPPNFTSVDPGKWPVQRKYRTQDPAAVLEDFSRTRLNWLQELKEATDEIWQREGNHAENGPITLISLAASIAKHDREHIRQIHETIKRLG